MNIARQLTDDQNLRATAYHEAGHAILIVLFGYEVERATIMPDDTGYPNVKPTRPESITPKHQIMIAMAGTICINVFRIASEEGGYGVDDYGIILTALDHILPEGTDEDRELLQDRLRMEVVGLFEQVAIRSAADSLASELLKQRTMDGKVIHSIVEPILTNARR